MSDIVINESIYQNINYMRANTANGVVAHAPIVAEAPEGVILLQYLDTTGNGCVDLGRKLSYPSTGYDLFMKFGVLSTDTQIIFSSATSSGASTDQLAIVSGKLRIDRISTLASSQKFDVAVNDIVKYCSAYGAETGSMFAENLTTNAAYGGAENANMKDITASKNMVLFAEPYGSSYRTFATVRFYEYCYSEGGVEVIHLFPAIDGNGVKCLYDSISQECIYSTNGAFETAS